MNKLFFKTFVVTFYRAFLGFFILLILVFGVFMEMKQHLLIAERLLQNSTGFHAILLIFLGYAFAQKRFQFRLLNHKHFRMFHQLGFFTWSQLGRNFLPVWLANHSLILAYSILLTYVGIGIRSGGKLLILWLFLIGLFLADITLLYFKLKKPFPESTRVRSAIFKKLKFEFWFLMHLRENRTLLILAVKIISIFLLNGFFYFYSGGGYDLRWLEFGLLCAAYCHFPIWMEKAAFEAEQLSYFHNMPISFSRKLWQHSVPILGILFPEIALIIYRFGSFENLPDLFFLLILLISLNMGIYGLVKWRNVQEKALKLGYLVFFFLFLLVIFGLPPLAISALCLIPFLVSVRSRYSV
ncbi:hypothetical protein PBT90_13345 [Algoriphagus halophytocola]|uniref:hypothetical protein n=1 Tax=Algoriphagus halophytocola TaxID=2991499 RepID=UPI0022DD2B19|nr:hypothetical protein [Algoriphagus sp. TR-M9]WBL41738.1 hypothetical protein PBT90_13345 [Algoriphagus sp. TR-M9]